MNCDDCESRKCGDACMTCKHAKSNIKEDPCKTCLSDDPQDKCGWEALE